MTTMIVALMTANIMADMHITTSTAMNHNVAILTSTKQLQEEEKQEEELELGKE